MGNIALWAKFKNSGEISGDYSVIKKLQFNYWYLDVKDKHNTSIDIGILLHNFKSLSELNLYLPLNNKNIEIKDLAKTLRDVNVLGAIFNESLSVNNYNSSKSFYVSFDDNASKNSESFIVYELDIKEDVSIAIRSFNSISGTQLCINLDTLGDLHKCSESNTCKDVYFRIRISGEEVHDAFIFSRGGNFFDALFHDTLTLSEFMDFRINQKRCLPNSLCESIADEQDFLNIEALHFLFLTKSTTNITSDSDPTIRRLEKRVWETYIPSSMLSAYEKSDDVLAYHWRCKPKSECSSTTGLKEWDNFILIKFPHRSVLNISIYLLFTLFLGVFINILSEKYQLPIILLFLLMVVIISVLRTKIKKRKSG